MSEFERCIRSGGVVVFPSDTVYGLACDPENADAVARLYALKGRPEDKPAAVMFFDVAGAAPLVPTLALALLPGGVTLLVPNPRGLYPLACGPDPSVLGLRVPDVPLLAGASVAVLQTSANFSGEADARTLEAVPEPIRAGADLVLDGGALPGVASTVVDLRRFPPEWSVVRQGAVPAAAVRKALTAGV